MKILWFSSYFPKSNEPERGAFNYQQARALSRLCEVRVAAPLQWFPVELWHGAGPIDVPWYEEIQGLPVWHPRYFLTPRIARDTHALQMAAAVLPQLARIRRTFPFDVIVGTWAFPDVVVAARAARRWKVPLVAKVHGSDINVQTEFPRRRTQISHALGQAHRVLAVSHALGERLQALGLPEERIMVRHNGIDLERFHLGPQAPARAELGLAGEGKQVVYVGFFNPAKAVHVLLDALAHLKQQGRLDFTTHLVGRGPQEPELRQQAERLGLGSALRFHPPVSHERVPLWMRASDVLCLPSVREGCPNVILEALASGRAVVASRVGGVPELTTEHNALLVPPGDAEALAGALRTALDRPWDETALRESVSHFSWSSSAEALFDAARDALQSCR